ncbi:hypothetical protein F5146DRAFT_135716 [Armillaria mellea]|nr:hypothetical protein F5146DRAFT_135716 [Armillaria mellea]
MKVSGQPLYRLRYYVYLFVLSLEPVNNQPNTYTVVSTVSGVLERLPCRTVTFTTPDPEALPLPSPTYLAIHAACCRVAHLSGTVESFRRKKRFENGWEACVFLLKMSHRWIYLSKYCNRPGRIRFSLG